MQPQASPSLPQPSKCKIELPGINTFQEQEDNELEIENGLRMFRYDISN